MLGLGLRRLVPLVDRSQRLVAVPERNRSRVLKVGVRPLWMRGWGLGVDHLEGDLGGRHHHVLPHDRRLEAAPVKRRRARLETLDQAAIRHARSSTTVTSATPAPCTQIGDVKRQGWLRGTHMPLMWGYAVSA